MRLTLYGQSSPQLLVCLTSNLTDGLYKSVSRASFVIPDSSFFDMTRSSSLSYIALELPH
jgi:hypothetical protein